MATPLSALGRIVFPYTISGLTHVFHAYVRNPQVTGGQWKINTRATDANDLNWEDAADALEATLANNMPTGATAGTAILQTRTGSLWLPQSFHTVPTWSPGASSKPAVQVTIVLRDINFKKIKVVVLEGIEPAPEHETSPAGGTTNLQNLVKQFLSTFTVTNAPYNWMVGRGNQYINTAGFVGTTITLNRKVRRARGLT